MPCMQTRKQSAGVVQGGGEPAISQRGVRKHRAGPTPAGPGSGSRLPPFLVSLRFYRPVHFQNESVEAGIVVFDPSFNSQYPARWRRF